MHAVTSAVRCLWRCVRAILVPPSWRRLRRWRRILLNGASTVKERSISRLWPTYLRWVVLRAIRMTDVEMQRREVAATGVAHFQLMVRFDARGHHHRGRDWPSSRCARRRRSHSATTKAVHTGGVRPETNISATPTSMSYKSSQTPRAMTGIHSHVRIAGASSRDRDGGRHRGVRADRPRSSTDSE
jgi:hypothetical protein